MVNAPDHERLDSARRRAGLSVDGLWIRYFELGGVASLMELDAVLSGALVPSRLERDVLAHAINEALMDKGLPPDVDYLFRAPTDPA